MSDDEEQYNPKAHKNLLQAISSLGKAQHIRKSTRSEPQQQEDEFRLVKGASADGGLSKVAGVKVNDIVQILKTTKKHLDAGKQLKNVQSTKKVLEKPLEKPAAERIKRTIGYEKTKKQLERWDAVVAQNRVAETQVFPLKSETIYVDTSAHSKPLQLSLKSDLMLEMEATEAKLKALKKERIGDIDDEQDLAKREQELFQKKLTRDELIARKRELAYLKMRESEKSAKARQRNKIKSKKYHKLLKRQKIQEQLKQFELLQKTNPEAALEKLNALEKSRVLERASLRHKNTGTWAKNLQVRAKYDKDVRKDLAEQLEISRQLTHKQEEDVESERDDEEQQKATLMHQQENETHDPFNPWTRAVETLDDNDKNIEREENWRKYWLERNDNNKRLEEYKGDVVGVNGDEVIEQGPGEDIKIEAGLTEKPEAKKAKCKNQAKKKSVTKLNKTKTKVENGWIVEEVETAVTKNEINIDDIFDLQEEKIKSKLNRKLKLLTKQANKLNRSSKKQKVARVEKDSLKNLKDLSFKNELQRPIIDEELTHEKQVSTDNKPRKAAVATLEEKNQKQDNVMPQADAIDPNKLATVKLRQRITGMDIINESLADVEMDEGEEHIEVAHQMTISEAFEDDDIFVDFSKDKSKDTELKNTEIELSMPGWGAWGGAGISKEYSQRNKRFVLNLTEKVEAEKAKRRDNNKGGVYINEEASKQLRGHLVSDIPFPFTSLQDYEASIRAPLGRNFVPETAFRMLTRPAVITLKGKVIEPMNDNELVKPARRLRHVVDLRIARAAKAAQEAK